MELILIPLIIVATVLFDTYIFFQIGEPEFEAVAESKWKNSIAVLPFADISPRKDQEYFCDGITEELINTLSKINDLKVVARTSAFSFKGKEMDIREIGKKLNVATILEGSVRKADNRLRITVQLINVANGYHIWSEVFERTLGDVFAIQDEISMSVAEKLKIKLLKKEEAKLKKRGTENLEAYNLYLKGRWFWNKRDEESLKKAINYFKQAIKLDPNFARAYAGLASAYFVYPDYSPVPPQEFYLKARKAAKKAIEIDRNITEAYTALAMVNLLNWDWSSAEEGLKYAIRINPNYATAHQWYGEILLYKAQFDRAIKELKRALELDPLSLVINRNLGVAFYFARQYDKAEEALQRTLELDPNFIWSHIYLSLVYIEKGMYGEALAELQKEKAFATSARVMLMPFVGIVYAKMGKREKAQEILSILIEKSKHTYIPPSFLAMLCFTLENNDLGFKYLEKAYEEKDSWLRYVKLPVVFDPIRSDPRFKALLKKIGLD
jgi:TolB-like protein/Tfp pilus assembly protein PilF